MLGLKNLHGVHRLVHVRVGEMLSSLYTEAADAYEMPAWATRLILCGVIVPVHGSIDERWIYEFMNATVVHVVYKRKIAVELTDGSFMDVAFPLNNASCGKDGLFTAIAAEIDRSEAGFFLEINGCTTQYNDAYLLPNTPELVIAVSFASPLRWMWLKLAI